MEMPSMILDANMRPTPQDIYSKLFDSCVVLWSENIKLLKENAKLVKVLHEVESEAVDAYLGLQHDCELLAGELGDRFEKHWHEQCENDKLRELVRDMWSGMCGYRHDCRDCEHYELYEGQRFVGECEYHRRMRELGVDE